MTPRPRSQGRPAGQQDRACSRPVAVAAAGAMMALLAVPLRAGAAEPDLPSNLSCVMKAVQTGQFQRLDYISGPTGGTIALSVVLSPTDLAVGRGVIIDDERASVATLVTQPGQTVLLDTGTTDAAATLSLFTRDGQEDAVPAAYSRQAMAGHIPLVSQYTGVCKPP